MIRHRIRILAAAVLAATLSPVAFAAPAHAVGNGIEIGTFAYVYPSDSYLTGLVSSTTTPTPPAWTVLNINNGFSNDVQDLDATSDSLRARGIATLGYVYTNYGARSLTDVKHDVDRWLDPNQYATLSDPDQRTDTDLHYNGIFIDTTPRDCGTNNANVAYYDELVDYIYDKLTAVDNDVQPQWVIANPGTAVEDCMVSGLPGVDSWVTFEGTSASYNSSGWLGGNVWNTSSGYYSGTTFGEKFTHIVYSASTTLATAEADVATADARGASYVFVTNDGSPNPYDTRPANLNSLITYAATLP